MPGLMFDFMGSGKRSAMGREATLASGIAARNFRSAVLGAASEARKALVELAFVEESWRLKDQTVAALEESLALSDASYSTGTGAGTLADHARVANDIAKARSERGSLGDRRLFARQGLKAAMGLGRSDPDPAWPKTELSTTALPSADALWSRALASNPNLGKMRSTVEMAIEEVEVARASGRPDFSLGTMVDLRTNPTLIRPLATMDLPIWRDKIAAAIAAAEARRDASIARVSAMQINLAAEFAQAIDTVSEADRTIAFVDRDALPGRQRSLEAAEAASQSGVGASAAIPETQIKSLELQMERLTALRDREIAVTDLMLLTALAAPAGSPAPQS